uniref:Uncharacterized protein n=1 Tax=Kalanchoe fedtschenkoi TaxID=63787 RepID=A0A7N0REH0_KALFE
MLCFPPYFPAKLSHGHLLWKKPKTKKASAAASGLWANDIVSRAVLGQKYTGEGDASEIMGALSRKASELTGAFSFRDFVPALSWLDSVTGFAGRVSKTSGALDAFLNQVINEYEIQSGNADDLDDMKDFVDIIFQLQREDRIGLYSFVFRTYLWLGLTRLHRLLEWMMAELARKPSAMKRVQEEIRLCHNGVLQVRYQGDAEATRCQHASPSVVIFSLFPRAKLLKNFRSIERQKYVFVLYSREKVLSLFGLAKIASVFAQPKSAYSTSVSESDKWTTWHLRVPFKQKSSIFSL